MRKQFIMCACRKTAQRRAPWASMICKADGGFFAFESATDGAIWKGQL